MAAGSEITAGTLLLEISNPRQMLFPISLTASDKGNLKSETNLSEPTDGFSGEVDRRSRFRQRRPGRSRREQ